MTRNGDSCWQHLLLIHGFGDGFDASKFCLEHVRQARRMQNARQVNMPPKSRTVSNSTSVKCAIIGS